MDNNVDNELKNLAQRFAKDPETAMDDWKAALAFVVTAGDRDGAWTLFNLLDNVEQTLPIHIQAELALLRGKYTASQAEAGKYFKTALAHYANAGDQKGRADALCSLGEWETLNNNLD